MKPLLALVLLVGLTASDAIPLHAQQMSVAEYQRQSAKEAGKQQKLMNKNFLLGSPQGQVVPFAPNPNSYKPASTISQKAFVDHNVVSLQGLLQKGLVPPSAPNPGTHTPRLTVSQKAFMGYSVWLLYKAHYRRVQ